MKRVGLSVTAAMVVVVCGATSRLQAQVTPFSPPINPYIGLLRTGASPGINWMNIVQPQMQLFGAANQLQAGQFNLGQAVMGGGGGANQMMVTGHPAMFGPNFLWFYGRGMMGGMGMGGGMGGMGMGGGMGGMRGGMGGMGMGGMGMGGMGMGGMGMGGMGMGGMGMGGMGMGGMGMGGMGMGGMGMGGMGRGMPR